MLLPRSGRQVWVQAWSMPRCERQCMPCADTAVFLRADGMAGGEPRGALLTSDRFSLGWQPTKDFIQQSGFPVGERFACGNGLWRHVRRL
jgi:hypothetical protein